MILMDSIVITDTFRNNIEELIDYAEKYDQELTEAIKWLDGMAQKEGMSFFEKVYEVLYKHDIKKKAREWMNDRN